MGMFDEITGEHLSLVCKAGHPLRYFQTKDLDCCGSLYGIEDGKLVGKMLDGRWPRAINIYDFCAQCPAETHHWSDGQPHQLPPWCEFEVSLDESGVITDVRRVE